MPTITEFSHQGIVIQLGNSLDLAGRWPTPTVVICDGPYGLNSYPGDLTSPRALPEWYEPHVRRWTEAAGPHTTLWFWNTEIGWATVHPLLVKYGWVYHSANVWDKGIGHIAGNSNTLTLRRFPPVTELCVQYFRPTVVTRADGSDVTMQSWLRTEWDRTGLPFRTANEACGVRNAATRKYLTSDDKWYMPPPETFAALVKYANQHGADAGKPYFDLGDEDLPRSPEYTKLRAKFNCPAGVTNVWHTPAVRGNERIKASHRAQHPNQKPLALMERIIAASSDPGDVVWEPFGGFCSAAVAAFTTARQCYSAEIRPDYHAAAVRRFNGIQLPLRNIDHPQIVLF